MKSNLKKYENCRNLLGHLSEDITDRLETFFNNPSIETWQDVYSIIIGSNGFTTFWQAVMAVDPNFPKKAKLDKNCNTIFDTHPDYFTARRALKAATKKG